MTSSGAYSPPLTMEWGHSQILSRRQVALGLGSYEVGARALLKEKVLTTSGTLATSMGHFSLTNLSPFYVIEFGTELF